MHFKLLLKAVVHIKTIRSAGKTAELKSRSSNTAVKTGRSLSSASQGKTGLLQQKKLYRQGIRKMARYEMNNMESAMGGEAQADVFCEMGLMYATGRGCDINLVSAHKWLNIAAIKGSERAALLRADLGRSMTKMELAQALRAAREWMTMH
jgi:TPR repeat protein